MKGKHIYLNRRKRTIYMLRSYVSLFSLIEIKRRRISRFSTRLRGNRYPVGKLTIRMFMKSSFIATTQIDSRFQLVICKRCSVIQWNASFLLSSSPRCIYTNRLFERRSIEVPQIRNKITKCKPAVGFQLRFVVNRITFRLCELVPVTRQG